MPAPSRIVWKCRRGMREMDILLQRFLERGYDSMDDAERRAFERLLDLPDQDILAWLCDERDPTDLADETLAVHAVGHDPLHFALRERYGDLPWLLRPFLARQLTCDLADLVPGRVLPGAWLTPKGRVLAVLKLLAAPATDALLAVLPASLSDAVCRRLRMFVLRDDVAIEPDDGLVVAGLLGPAVDSAREAINRIYGKRKEICAANLAGFGQKNRFGSAGRLDAVLGTCAAHGAHGGDDNDWRLHQVAAGFPDVLP